MKKAEPFVRWLRFCAIIKYSKGHKNTEGIYLEDDEDEGYENLFFL